MWADVYWLPGRLDQATLGWMKALALRPAKALTPEKQLTAFIEKFVSATRRLIRLVRQELRRRLPGYNELVYDNFNFFVIGYSPTERPSDCVLSLTAAANGVALCFIQGASLADPHGILLGSGKQTRFLRIDSVGVLTLPEVGGVDRGGRRPR